MLRKIGQEWTLHRRDQKVVVAIVGFGWGIVIAILLWKGAPWGSLLDVDRTLPKAIRYQIDINSADWIEFAALPGIGEAKGRRITRLRRELGRFERHDDLLKVRGIGPKTMETLRPHLLPLPPKTLASETLASETSLQGASRSSE